MTKRLWLAFDGDAAGESAALRGMELAAGQGFDVKIVALHPGVDPADDPSGFEAKLARAEPYLLYRTRIEVQRASDPGAAHRTVKALLDAAPESPERREAWRWATDRLGTITIRAAVPTAREVAASPRLIGVLERQERSALAGVVSHPELKALLAELPPEHFRDERHRTVRDYLVDGTPLDRDSLSLLAELDAIADREGIDKKTGTELLLRLRERELRAELERADLERTRELQEQLTKVREAVAGLGTGAAIPD